MKFLCAIILLAYCFSAMGQPVDTEFEYNNVLGKGITIQNSLPKGGFNYIDPAGIEYRYVIFWTRVANNTPAPLTFTMSFPADSINIPSLPLNYFKLLLPPQKMTVEKIALFNYGFTGLKTFLNTQLGSPTRMSRTILPQESTLFYVVVLHHLPLKGIVRAGLRLKEQALLYNVNGVEIPCGKISF